MAYTHIYKVTSPYDLTNLSADILVDLNRSTRRSSVGKRTDYAAVELGTVTNEVVQLTVAASGGTFTVTYGGQTTAALAYNITNANLEAALVGLSSIGAKGVIVQGGPGDLTGTTPYYIQFTGSKAGTDATAVTTDATSLTGGAHTATVTVLMAGADTPEA